MTPAPQAGTRAARWTAAAAGACGAILLVISLAGALRAFPGPAALAAAVQVPALMAGLVLARWLHPVRSPPVSWSAAALAWGMTAAAGCAVLADRGLAAVWARSAGPAFASHWSAALSAPLNEELLMASGVALIAVMAPLAVRDALDGMIYGALIGLGFQAIVNTTQGIAAILATGATDPVRAALQPALVRAGLAVAGPHWAPAAVAGAGIGCLAARGLRGAVPACALFGTAIAIHLAADLPGASALARAAASLAAVVAVYLVVRHSYLTRIRNVLDARTAFGMNGERDTALLMTRRGRRRARRQLPPGPRRDQLAQRQQVMLSAIEDQAAGLAG